MCAKRLGRASEGVSERFCVHRSWRRVRDESGKFGTWMKESFAMSKWRGGNGNNEVPSPRLEELHEGLSHPGTGESCERGAWSIFHCAYEIAGQPTVLPQKTDSVGHRRKNHADRTRCVVIDGMDVRGEAGCASARHDIVQPWNDRPAPETEVAPPERSVAHQALPRKEDLQAAQHGRNERGGHVDLSAWRSKSCVGRKAPIVLFCPTSQNRLLPVISAGCGMFIIFKSVGATSHSAPSVRNAFTSGAPTTITGTGYVVWAVCGDPSS